MANHVRARREDRRCSGMTDNSMRIVLCGCASCPIREAGFESYRSQSLCLGPWMVVVGCPARLLGCQFASQEAAEQWVRDESGARLH